LKLSAALAQLNLGRVAHSAADNEYGSGYAWLKYSRCFGNRDRVSASSHFLGQSKEKM
jgi:hypothetical protein